MARRSKSAGSPPAPKRETHIISNIRYVKQPKEILGKLKYFTYRDDRDDHFSHAHGTKRRRWIDQGLGDTYRAIFNNCQALQSKDVLAWTYVISPDPALMELVPERKRRALVERLTESIIEEYYEARDEAPPRYSYVLHDRDASTGKQQLHTHVILPGTVETMDGDKPFYNNRRDGHIELFNQLAEDAFERELTELGIQWQPSPEPVIAGDIAASSDANNAEENPPESERDRLIAEILNQWDWNF